MVDIAFSFTARFFLDTVQACFFTLNTVGCLAVYSNADLSDLLHRFSLEHSAIEVLPISSVSIHGILIKTDENILQIEFETEECRRRFLNALHPVLSSFTIDPASNLVIPNVGDITSGKQIDIFERIGAVFVQSSAGDWSLAKVILSRTHIIVTSLPNETNVLFRCKLKKLLCFNEPPNDFINIPRFIKGKSVEISDIVVLKVSESDQIDPFSTSHCSKFLLGFTSFPLAMLWVKDIRRNVYNITGKEEILPFWMIFLSDFISKRGAGKLGFIFRRRFFVLHKSILSYYEHESDPTALGVIPLEEAEKIELVEDLILHIHCSKRTWILKFSDQNSRELWSNALNKVICGLKEDSDTDKRSSQRSNSGTFEHGPSNSNDNFLSEINSPESESNSSLALRFKPMSGYLLKLGQINRSFKSRYCKIFPGSLHYFLDDSPLSFPKGAIILANSVINKAEEILDVKFPHAFAIKTTSRIWIFRATSQESRDEWVEALRLAALLPCREQVGSNKMIQCRLRSCSIQVSPMERL
ncbi:hypothetical protein RCL1_005799 [Eukaryota sp. TZLM3-RCL]